jgi:hypothetical protein
MTTIMHRVINTDPPLVSDLNFQIHSTFDALVLKSLAKKTSERFQTAEEFSSALNEAYKTDKKSSSSSNVSNDATVMISGQDDSTIDLPSAEIPTVTPGPTGEDLEHKFDKIVGLLESRGIITHEADHSAYNRARTIVLAVLSLLLISISSYAVWLIYTEELTYVELKQIAIEKTQDIKALVTGKKGDVVEVSRSGKKKPEQEFKREPAIVQEEKEALAKQPTPTKPENKAETQETTQPSATPSKP